MATPANAIVPHNSATLREYLKSGISIIDPHDTPFTNAVKRMKAKSYLIEVAVDSLRSDDTAAKPYGDDISYTAQTSGTRKLNITQLGWRPIIVTEEENRTSHAGFARAVGYQTMKASKEHARDREKILIGLNQAADKPTNTNLNVGKTGTMLAIFESNTDKGTSGVDGGYDSTTNLPVARTDGTQRQLTQTLFDSMIEKAFGNSGNDFGRVVMCNLNQKRRIDAFAGLTNQRYNTNTGASPVTIVQGATAVIAHDNMSYKLMLNRHMRNREVMFLSMMGIKIEYLYWDYRLRLARTGLTLKSAVASNFGLCIRNEKEHGLIADLTA